jgi:hypothetical protein
LKLLLGETRNHPRKQWVVRLILDFSSKPLKIFSLKVAEGETG